MAYAPKTDAEQKVIVAQNAATAAAAVFIALNTEWDPVEFERIRRDIFRGTLELTLSEVVVEGADGVERPVVFEQPSGGRSSGGGSSGGGGGGGNPGAFVLGFGAKHKGKTIEAIYAEDPNYVTEFLAEKTNHNQTKNAARKYVAGLAA